MTANPVILPDPARGEPLSVRVTFPATGTQLPIILFSHGYRYSKDDYQPLVETWAASGFAVLQPTHLDSDTLALPSTDPRTKAVWRYRMEDMKLILNQLDRIEAETPGLKGRLARGRIAAVGHSYGGHTVEALLGARIFDAVSGKYLDFSDARVKLGVLLSPPGEGRAQLTPEQAVRAAFLDVNFADMKAPALVIVGDKDTAPMTISKSPVWHADPYLLSPGGGKCLWTIAGAKHWLGGIGGTRDTETTDADPARVAAIGQVTVAWLKSGLYPNNTSWPAVRRRLEVAPAPGDRFECK